MKIFLTKKLSLEKLDITFKITIMLVLLWIIISLINNRQKHGNTIIQRNSIAYWLLISISFSLSKYFFNNYLYFFIFLFGIVIIHEILWYGFYIKFTKDEGEVTNNWYRWANIYCNSIKDIDGLSGTDLTEGIFNNNWNLSNKEALELKYLTYFNYLKLEKGMDLLDIGCGNCSWLNYCKKKGVNCTGITITTDQANFCKSKGINDIIVGDIHKDILLKINKKFDVITNIGALEHFSSLSQPENIREKTLKKYYLQVKNLIKKNSKSKRYLNSVMCTSQTYKKNVKWHAMAYLIASSFGYGAYPGKERLRDIYDNGASTVIIERDCTEDYRWILVRSDNTWGYCNYRFNSPFQFFNFCSDVITDPAWFHRILYGYFNAWFWQFGGTSKKPIPHIVNTPIRSYIYVTEINNL